MNKTMRFVANAALLAAPLIVATACSEPSPATSSEVTPVVSAAPIAATTPEPAVAIAPSAEPAASLAAEASATPNVASPARANDQPKAKLVQKSTPPAVASSAQAPAPEASAAPAAPVVVDASSQLAQQIDAIFAGAKTFRARFEQSYNIAAQGVEKRSTGTLIVARPGKLAFVYDTPNGNRLVSDGKELHVYDAGSQQDIVQPVAKAQLPGAFGFLMGQGIAGAFHFQMNPNGTADRLLLLGKPIEATPSYERVQFTIDSAKLAKKDVGALAGVLVIDAQKNKNRFTFTDQTIPEKVADTEFAFTPPAGTSVKRM